MSERSDAVNGWVVLCYLSAGMAGAIAFLRVIAVEISNDDRNLARQERMLRLEWELAHEEKKQPEESDEPVEAIVVRPYGKNGEAGLN